MLRKTKIYSLLVLACLAMSHWSYGKVLASPQVNISVTVVDEDGTPIEGAEVQGLFKGMGAGGVDDIIVKQVTDSEGVTQLSRRTRLWVLLTVRKEGYYPSNQELKTVEWDRKSKKNIYYSDQAVTLVLRDVRNPTPMYAYEFDVTLGGVSEARGFDLVKNDWVAPWGSGVAADLIFKVTGYFNDYSDNDSTLSLSFANEADGIQSFTPHVQSDFQSPYTAPLDGYKPQMSWQKKKQVTPDPSGKSLREHVDVIDDTATSSGYLFRIRSVLNEDGDVVSALYGKIYGRFKFAGASKDGTFIRGFQVYLNPSVNDRNLEWDRNNNLQTGLKSWNHPKAP